jgi:peptidoglycan/LPS O-acetylase OafA/YrhL
MQRAADSGGARLVAVDLLKALAISWIFLNHVIERLFGTPTSGRAALATVSGHGVWDLPLTLLRWVGLIGDQGVGLFLVASGFLLARSQAARGGAGAPLAAGAFLRARLARIYPMWWTAHLLALPVLVAAAGSLSAAADPSFWCSFAGFRGTPGLFYAVLAPWWFVGLLIQLYLVFPLLWGLLRRLGPARALALAVALGLAARAVGLALLDGAWLDVWQRGAFFPTRLPELALGAAAALYAGRAPRPVARFGLGVLAWAAGMAASFSPAGRVVAPLLLSGGLAAALWVVLAPLARRGGPLVRAGAWVGRHSYPVYLVHHAAVLALVPASLVPGAGWAAWAGALGAALATGPAAVGLERLTTTVQGRVTALARRVRLRGLLWRGAVAAAGAGALLVAGELVVRAVDPQEVWGWGERPALVPHERLGWALRPGTTTRLRWDHYDYVVHANALGLPGPDPVATPPPGGLRVLVTGDAFASAEGVDTAAAWPRLVERPLGAALGRPVEVVNASVTGWGPNQYAAALTTLAPTLRPDVVVVSFFVNDFTDALTPDDTFRAAIGFGQRDPGGWGAVLRLAHLRHWLRLRVLEPLSERLTGQPRPHGWRLAGLSFLERTWPEREAAVAAVDRRLAGIAAAAPDARRVLLLVPAAAQVCPPAALAYHPRGTDIADARFDADWPQRTAATLGAARGFAVIDLRPLLATAGRCPFHPGNMHWTAAGHRHLAAALAPRLAALAPAGPAPPPPAPRRRRAGSGRRPRPGGAMP